MQNQNDLAINLLKLTEPDSYKEFGEGFLTNRPQMSGMYYTFKDMRKPYTYLIINTSSAKYPSPMLKTKANDRDILYIVFNVASPEEYFENVIDVYIPQIVEILDNNIEKKNTRNLPYGYYLDENGDLQLDNRAVLEVRKIYDMYIDTKSIRQIAQKLRTNFSDIREILHDAEEYMQMQPPIMSRQKLMEVAGLMAANVRGGAVAKRKIEDEIADVRRRRKEREKAMQQN